MGATTVVLRVPLKDKIMAWSLTILSYLFTFVTPMVAAYYLLAFETMEESGRGGLLYFIIVGVFGGAGVITALKILNKQKSNIIKTILRASIKVLFMLLVLRMVEYVDFNLDKLMDVIYITIGGFLMGSLIEAIAVQKYTDYIREVGVF